VAGTPTVILGAGLAGLSVARALVRECPGAPIVLVDRRTAWTRDRTWCFWAVPGLGDAAARATASWSAWQVVGPDGRVARQRSDCHPYLHLPADRFYEAALAELARAPQVSFATGVRVLGVTPARGGVRVETTAGELHAALAVDAMGARGPLLRGRPDGAVELRQRFVGLEVETERPVFDPATATLMDFRLADGPGVRFAYVLPFSRTRALVEDTSMGGPVVDELARRRAIARYLEEILGAGAVAVRRTERGTLPMTTFAFPVARSSALVAAGEAAGAARPSSGYAFVRTQRHAAALARALARGGPIPSPAGPPRRRRLDALFLRALEASPGAAPEWFAALASRSPGDVFARFMADASTPADEARVVAAVACPSFVRAMGRGSLVRAMGRGSLVRAMGGGSLVRAMGGSSPVRAMAGRAPEGRAQPDDAVPRRSAPSAV